MAGNAYLNGLMTQNAQKEREVYVAEVDDLDYLIGEFQSQAFSDLIGRLNGFLGATHEKGLPHKTGDALKQIIERGRVSLPQEKTRRNNFIATTPA